jgi:hypothetical protein
MLRSSEADEREDCTNGRRHNAARSKEKGVETQQRKPRSSNYIRGIAHAFEDYVCDAPENLRF